MAKRILVLLAVVGCIYSTALGQKDDPVLFTVAETPVHLSEFNYIYTKTNGKKADFSKTSLEEYLDLYVKFKLKVQRAKEMQLDTIPTLQRELEGYRRQLADSYLIDKEVTERLIKEAYERTQKDIDISHIMIEIPKDASPADTLDAYNKALSIKARLTKGEDFSILAQTFSADKSAKTNGGNIGYVTALFPNGFYQLETAAYSLPIGVFSDPVRTNAGYHIVKVNGSREARGEMEVAHILIRKPAKDQGNLEVAKTRIDSIYTALKGGANFDDLAKTLSQDKLTASKGGYIGFFGINRYEKAFEDGAFGLTSDGHYSQPIESKVGWHIIKRISKKEVEAYNIAKGRLEGKIKQDARFELAKKAMIERIKKEANYTPNPDALNKFIGSLNEEFLTYKWKAPTEKSSDILFGLGNTKVNLGEFTDFLGRASRQRIRAGQGTDLAMVVNELYLEFVNEQVLKYEESQLEAKYPEFKALMREYEEGILLFEATKMLVWDKASQDTLGLSNFFDTKAKGKYQWEERADITEYKLSAEAKGQLDKIKKFAKKNDAAAVLAKFNTADKKIITASSSTVEKGRNKTVDAMKWKAEEISEDEIDSKDQSVSFVKIEKIVPQSPKTLKEARGYVVADYQDFLERQWIEELKKDYLVKIDETVLKSMVK